LNGIRFGLRLRRDRKSFRGPVRQPSGAEAPRGLKSAPRQYAPLAVSTTEIVRARM
jgi:hypothetical protein